MLCEGFRLFLVSYTYTHTHTHMHTYTYLSMYMKSGKSIFRVCVYVNSLLSCQLEGFCLCNELYLLC
jgi:hypothetical protein